MSEGATREAMDFSLQPVTGPGRKLAALAEGHVEALAAAAGEHDREASFPTEAIEALHASGVLTACVPEEFGGLGVESVHDFALAIGRLGRGDGSVALATNMHVSQTWLLAWHWRSMRDTPALAPHAMALAGYLRQIVGKRLLMSSAVAEAGTDILHPRSEARRTEDGGWVLNAKKMFGTLSPAAEVFQVTCRVESDQGPRFAIATVPKFVAGVEVKNNWDALGMRGSGSHDVWFTDCRLPAFAVAELGAWGEWNEAYLAGNVVITLGLVAAFLGIAEAARDHAVGNATSMRKVGRAPAERPAVRQAIAEIEIDLAAARAMLARTALATDAFFRAHGSGRCPMDQLHALMKDFQCTKWFVTTRAVAIVDRALTASGGGAYLARNPLSRLYRDVRAGSFMQPYSPNEAFEYIGRVALGLPVAGESAE
jgi:L-evernosamine nitrososynthase